MRKQQSNPPPPEGVVKPPPPPAPPPPGIHIDNYLRRKVKWDTLMELKRKLEQCTPK